MIAFAPAYKCLQEAHSVSAPVGKAVSLLYRRFRVSIFFQALHEDGILGQFILRHGQRFYGSPVADVRR